jgi:hypothetical protein
MATAQVQSKEEVQQVQFLQSLDAVHQIQAKNRKEMDTEVTLLQARRETSSKTSQSTMAVSTKPPLVLDGGKKPLIGKPQTTALYDPFGDDPAGDNINIVAVCRAALACQLSINSQFWSNSWNQATATMQTYAKFAPVVYDATINDWNGQAQVTEDQGQKAKAEGMVMLGLAVTSVIMGVAQTYKAGSEIKSGIGVADEAKSAAAGRAVIQGQGAGAAGDAIGANGADDAERAAMGTRASRAWDAMKAGGKWSIGKFAETAAAAGQAAQLNQLMSNAIISYFYEPVWSSKIAKDQQVVGQAEATAKQTEMFAQYYSTQSNRTYDLGSGASQMIDTCYNLLTSIADNVAATSRQMFQG